MNTEDKQAKKAIRSNLADPETYLETIAECMSEDEKNSLSPHHIANVMALSAELMLTYAGSIGRSLEDQIELDVTLEAKLAKVKDTVQIQFKRSADLKDSASAEVPDPNQAEMDFKDGAGKTAPAACEQPAPETPMGLPAPMKGLPAPVEAEVVDEEDSEDENASDEVA